MPNKTLLLFHPEELGWIVEFTKELQEKVLEKKWTALLHHFAQLGVERPGHCSCEQPWELSSWLHANHAEYNVKVRAAIMTSGARIGLFKALYRVMAGVPLTPEQEAECPKLVSKQYGEQLLDFLRAAPKLGWFKPPFNTGRMYQGSALEEQERNPGRTN